MADPVRALRRFVAAHGGSGTAFVEYVGRNAARVVVLGADGRWGDVVVPGAERAVAAAEAAGLKLADGWEREHATALRTTSYEWSRMGGR